MSPSAAKSVTRSREPWASAPEAIEAWRDRERRIFGDVFRPSPHLTPSQWADKYRILSQGPMAGLPWSNENAPYLAEIMDFVVDPWARRGVVRKSARVGFTEGVIGNLIAYTIDQDPCNIAVLQPSDKEAEQYSKEQITPMVRLNDRIRERLGELNTRRSDSTMTYKEFPGGYLLILGSASDKNLRRRSIRRAFADEVDGMRVEGAEGDPILRFLKRTDDFEDGVLLIGSTPTIKGASRIDREFERSDQRFWHVPCPHCGEFQVLKWGGPRVPYGIKWAREVHCKRCGMEADPKAEKCPECGGEEFDARYLPHTAHYVCEFCALVIEERQKPDVVRAGRWIAMNPGASIPGWHIDALVSLFVGARWPKLVEEWRDAKEDPEDLKVFINTVLGEAYEERGLEVEVSSLEKRAEEYVDREGNVVDVPDGVGVLTSFTDVQGSWLELLVRGWGVGLESWDILHERIYGDPEAETTWARLEALLTRSYRHELGGDMRIMASLIDAGYLPDTVYGFTKPRLRRNVFPSIGDKTGSPNHDPIKMSARPNSAGVRIVRLGTFKLKDRLFKWLRIQRPGPRYMHLRAYNPDRCNGFDPNYYKQFEAEKRVTRRLPGSRRAKAMYIQTMTRNETVDLHVGNFGALQVLGTGVTGNMEAWVETARRPTEDDEEEAPDTDLDTAPRGWVNAW